MPADAAPSQDVKRRAARENTQLDRQQLSYCVSLIENGANPEALAKVIRELREEYGTGSVDGGAEEAGGR
ncbi:hypothetical protein GRF29_154g1103295 [Pseudopithomyces chartarum]|uniref:Mitotic-spindle organizing protein 1 n=1 Tax=Pseudopithomyces chartarum TaxID=1892770 RepID=A0AAN6RDU8_9PLEO|nr:hypothetical protein GRF29_154g1103295 [Pseudopithomyces chartarum]